MKFRMQIINRIRDSKKNWFPKQTGKGQSRTVTAANHATLWGVTNSDIHTAEDDTFDTFDSLDSGDKSQVLRKPCLLMCMLSRQGLSYS